MSIIFNEGQKHGVEVGKNWLKTLNKQTFEISGGPGTGKTTMISYLIDEFKINKDKVIYITYVGRAALIMRMKGNSRAFTIHKVIYNIEEEIKLEKLPNGKIREVKTGRLILNLKKELDFDVELIVVDEAGMVPEKLAIDILSFNIPVIALGDLDQLPPIFGTSYFLKNPDVILKEPMRQALNSPIVRLCYDIINGNRIPIGKYGNNVFIIPKSEIKLNHMRNPNMQLLCGKNETRRYYNELIRENIYGFSGSLPQQGDRLICRKNNWDLNLGDISLVNGLSGVCQHVYETSFNRSKKKETFRMDFKPDFMNDYFQNISVDYKYLNGDDRKTFGKVNKFEYAYALTTHLVQGSQYKAVYIIDESYCFRQHRRNWLYTAASRATDMVVIAM